MRTIKIDAPVDYCAGHLRYGSYIGTVNLSFEVEDYEIDDIGEITDVNWSEE